MKAANSLFAALLVLIMPCSPVSAQEKEQPKPYVNRGQFLSLPVDTKPFQEEMPLAKFLQVLEKQLPKEKNVKLRIDAAAFGDDFCDVAKTPIRLPEYPKRLNLRTALSVARSKIAADTDWRLGDSEFIITTPERAAYTAVHDLQNIKADRVLWALDAVGNVAETVQIVNGTRLVIRANDDGHRQVTEAVQMFRRLDDLHVTLKARLYQVDEGFYQKLKAIKPVPLEEAEQDFLAGRPSPRDPLFKLLKKQKLILSGDEITVADGKKLVMLSRHNVRRCLPSPEHIRKGDKTPQTILLGVSFQGQIQVSPDRRFVQVKLTEKATELQEIKKIKSLTFGGEAKVVAEIPFLNVTAHTQVLEIPDGGTILVPVQIRSPELPRDRYWVLAITPRIRIEEEERMIEKQDLDKILPAVAADVLKNPRLKALREFYGSPGDKRFTLLDTSTWTWTKEDRPKVAGYEWTLPNRTGKRLLGIRIDQTRQEKNGGYIVTASLVNAGGSENSPTIGGGTIHYRAHSTEKGWQVELVEKD